jgi:hypothetical protein
MKNAVFWVLRCVHLLRTDVPEECIASIITVARIGKLGTTLAFIHSTLKLLVTANVVSSLPILVTLMMEVIRSSETSILRSATRHNTQKTAFFFTSKIN